MAGARWFVNPARGRRTNPWIKEIVMPFANPRRHRRRHHRSHARHSRNWPIIVNPRHRRHRGRGGAVGGLVGGTGMFFRNPGDLLMGGAVGSVAAFAAIAVPNWLLPTPGTGLMDKVIRFASRAAAGGLLYTLIKQMAPRYAASALTGVTIAVGGGAVFDLMGVTLAIGRGDTILLPGQLLPTGFSFTGYTRPMGTIVAPRHAQLGAYTPRQVAFRGIHGPGSWGVSPELGTRVYG